jgi:hypothetical protein
VSPLTSAKWGALVSVNLPSAVTFMNSGGCVAVISPQDEPCGETIEAQFRCDVAACSLCAVDWTSVASRDAQLGELQECFVAANQGECASLASAATACASALSADVFSACFSGTNDLGQLFDVMGVMCGDQVGLPDASVDDAALEDAGVEAGAPAD